MRRGGARHRLHQNRGVDLILNTLHGRESHMDDENIRRAATQHAVPCVSNRAGSAVLRASARYQAVRPAATVQEVGRRSVRRSRPGGMQEIPSPACGGLLRMTAMRRARPEQGRARLCCLGWARFTPRPRWQARRVRADCSDGQLRAAAGVELSAAGVGRRLGVRKHFPARSACVGRVGSQGRRRPEGP